MSKIKLRVQGVSYNDPMTQPVYVLLMVDENSVRYLPIVIGAHEAQAIYMQIEHIRVPRPLTHDLMLQMAKAFGIELVEVNIYLQQGHLFQAELLCLNHEKQLVLDARASDGVALALRFQCPIFTTEEVMSEAGMTLDDVFSNNAILRQAAPCSVEELHLRLNDAIAAEDYEMASRLRDELKKRENS